MGHPSEVTRRVLVLRTVVEHAARAFWAVQALHNHTEDRTMVAGLHARARYHGLTEELILLTSGGDVLAILGHAATDEELLNLNRLMALRKELGIRLVEMGELPSSITEEWWEKFFLLLREPGSPVAEKRAQELASGLEGLQAADVLARAEYYAGNILPDWLRLLRRAKIEALTLTEISNDWLPRI